MEALFTINGNQYVANSSTVPLDTSLNDFIRCHAKLTGTKFMCLEGGCGACIVTLRGTHPVTKEKTSWAVNSCLQNVYSCHGLDITTVEGVGSKKDGMHKVQKRLADFNGTQCGFCTPGMVMNMFSLLESRDGKVTMAEVENAFGGNICRCTGYRPILDAFKSLATDADKKLLDACHDIEDLSSGKMCPKSGAPCAGKCKKEEEVNKLGIRVEFEDDRQWHKVFNVGEIFKVFEKIGDAPYMLVAGNTAHGVYRRSNDLKVFIDITGVEELRTHKVSENVLELGGAVTLTEAMEIFTKVANENKNFEYLHEIVKHFDLIANVPVRNNGTLAGNLMIKNAHNEFPSDVFVCFEAVGAAINNQAQSSSWTSYFNKGIEITPKDFVTTDMSKKVLTKITLPGYDPAKFIFRSYKIMPRAQNAHAYVNAAFLLQLSESKVVSAKLCFGGIDPKFVHATNTEAFLVDKNLYDNSTLQRALAVLTDEIKPDWVLPDASPEYRKNLALALFYKFVLSTAPKEKIAEKFKSGGEILKRDLSSGSQSFDTHKENWPLTKNIPKIEADVQCTGEAKYVNDHPTLPNELHAAFVTGKYVHGVIKSIDASKALKLPGVVAFFSAKDIPGTNNFMPTKMEPGGEDEEIFASTSVRFHHQPVGVIVAETFELANRAAELVEISYKENDTMRPILPTLRDAIESEPDRVEDLPQFSRKAQGKGVETGLKITGRFELGLQYHYTMETQTCMSVPIEDGIDVYSATQWMDSTQIAIADMLKLPNNAVNMNVRRLGGGYGGKISRGNQIACACSLAAYLLNRPVRFVMKLEANMSVVGKRYACINYYDAMFDNNGKIQELNSAFTEDYGCSRNEKVHMGTAEFFNNCYEHKFFKLDAKAAITDAPANTWCRAPGTVEGIAMIENIMDHIAFAVKKDPVDVRIANLPGDGEMHKYLTDFIKSTDYRNRRKEIETFNANNRWTKRGIAIVPMKYPVGYFGTSHALVSIYHGDGSVSVTVGGIEMGQGLNTKVAQTTAYALGIPLEKVSVKPSNSLTAPNAIVTGGSIGSEISCHAVKKACEIINERLKHIKEENKNAQWTEIVDKAYATEVDLAATYMYKASELKAYNIWAASCCEVEVDILTGNILVKRVDIVEDVGESMSPGIDIGQIEGGFVMGLGYWLSENLIYHRLTGELLTNRTWNYKPPGAKDIPIDFRISFLSKSSNPFGVLRSKATGEPSTAMAIVALFALHHALDSARKDAGALDNGYQFDLGAPTTTENIFLAAGTKFDQFLLK